ncbi:Beta-galactosidase 8 [Ranunculus cassubicifolius]
MPPTDPSSSTMAPMTSSSPQTFPTSHTQFSLTPNTINFKLKPENYHIWVTLFMPVLKSNSLLGFITGSHPCPKQYLSLTDEQSNTENPEYTKWVIKDQNLMIWLTGAISDPVLPYIVGCTSSKEVWDTLARRFKTKSRSQVIQLKTKLQNLKKGDQSITEYLKTVKETSDLLAAAGSIVDDGDLLVYILNGLPAEFDAFSTSIRVRSDEVTIDELHALLLNEELVLQSRNKTLLQTETSAQAFSARFQHQNTSSQRNQSYQHRGRGRGRGRYNPSRGSSTAGRGILGPNPSPQQSTNSSSNYSPQDKQPCQICGRFNHSAIDCYERMNYSYQGRIPPQKLQAMVADRKTAPHSAQWYIDSGATNHITSDMNNLHMSENYYGPDKISVGDGQQLPIYNSGMSVFSTPNSDFLFKKILHVPQISHNLLSVHQLCTDNNCLLTFSSDGLLIKDKTSGQILFQGPHEDGLYPITLSSHNSLKALLGIKTTPSIWHQRLGHPSSSVFNKVFHQHNLPISSKLSNVDFCSFCQEGKCSKLPFIRSSIKSIRPLQLLHIDLWGPAPTNSISGFRYYASIIDDYSRYCWIFPLYLKSNFSQTFQHFTLQMQNLFQSHITAIRTDAGGEFTSDLFEEFLLSKGIQHQFSCPHTPEQNGIVERKHRHITELGRTLFSQSSIPHKYWVEVYQTAVYLINRLPTPLLNFASPYSVIFNKEPDYSFLKSYGCACFPWTRPYTTNKFQPRTKECVFIGYSPQHHGYRCLHIPTGRVYVSRHVTFNELHFPFKSTIPNPAPSSIQSPTVSPTSITITTETPLPQPINTSPPTPLHITTSPPVPTSPSPNVTTSEPQHPPPTPTVITPTPAVPVFVPNIVHTRSKSGIQKRRVFAASKYPLPSALSPPSSSQIDTPTCFTTANMDPQWRQAMADEFTALLKTQTWTLVPPAQHQNVIGCRWIYKLKHKSNGDIERRKARLVAKGYNQQSGIDYTETFSPVAKPTTIRVILSIAVQQGWTVQQLDVSNAFLHGKLNEDIYMSQPPGFIHPQYPSYVCKLQRSIYGLKQAPRVWFSELLDALLNLGFVQSKADSSLCIQRTATSITYILIYVDDILLTGSSPSHCQAVFTSLSKSFALKNLGPIHFFLGLEVKRNSTTLLLHQTKYVLDLLSKHNMLLAKPASTPMSTSIKLDNESGDPLEDPTPYRSLVGALQYLTWTRPDISFSVNQVCQYLHAPRTPHLTAAKRILRYLKGTVNHGLSFTQNPSTLIAYSDADWAGSISDRRSCSGYCLYFAGNLIAWSAKKQATVARSSTESEYRSLAHTATEISWVTTLLKELQIPLHKPPLLYCDNLSALALASNPVFHARTKHIEVDYHYIRELVLSKSVLINYVCSKDQIADIFTKGLSTVRFNLLKSKLTVLPTSA